MFGALGNIASLMKQAREMGRRMESLQAELKQRRATGAAGGGLVEVEVNGLQEVLACRIDRQLLAQNDAELLEDLICGAVNDAVNKSKQLHAETLKSMTGGLELPGLDDMISRMSGGTADAEAAGDDQSEDKPDRK